MNSIKAANYARCGWYQWGKPYYLVPANPTKGFGDLQRAEMLVPQWVIAEFLMNAITSSTTR